MTAIAVDFSVLENVALENILSFSMNQQVLSKNFELIISALKALGKQLSNFKGNDGNIVDNSDLLKELQRMVENHDKKIKQQDEQIAIQQKKNQEQDELIAQQQKKNQEQDERLSGLENMIQFLKGEIENLKKENQTLRVKNEQLEVGSFSINRLKKEKI